MVRRRVGKGKWGGWRGDHRRVGADAQPEGGRVRSARRTPHGEANVLVLNRLDVEANRRDGGDNLAKLELVEDGGLTGGVETDHQNAHILLAEELAEELAEREAHLRALCVCCRRKILARLTAYDISTCCRGCKTQGRAS